MKKVDIKTTVKKLLADVYTPVGIYLRLRDRFRDTILLESTDFHTAENSYSFICVNAVAGVEITDLGLIETKMPAAAPKRQKLESRAALPHILWSFMSGFSTQSDTKEGSFAQTLYGYATYDAVQFFDTVEFGRRKEADVIPLMRYRLYQYVIAINHFKDELFICENGIAGVESEAEVVESLIKSKDVPVYPFRIAGEEVSNMTDAYYLDMIQKGIQNCRRGDVFQIVLSRRFQRRFTGDEFNVYRALRNINPSPYLFFFDYGDYKLMGSSPESQIIIKDGKAIVHPIAGTVKRTGDEAMDKALTEQLKADPKETSEHVMLVDLARNDLSRICDGVKVDKYREVQYYSHVIHLVSEVTGNVPAGTNPFMLMAKTFPAGTLSGAPKFRAMELIDRAEPTARSFYGGCIGAVSFNGDCNMAIMIRSFLSKNNTLTYQAGGGVVVRSKPEAELQEYTNKLNALKKAIEVAQTI